MQKDLKMAMLPFYFFFFLFFFFVKTRCLINKFFFFFFNNKLEQQNLNKYHSLEAGESFQRRGSHMPGGKNQDPIKSPLSS